ncbi:aminodeoxychorismate synthase component I [Marinobacterium rhizophilum]|uniref:aminodeoxychorismate synthase component I n=1 Tax=Marinobacterium rhizophilum TaxID=420402 RepID=UPI00037E01A2|nr:aminodeoxychorismate synthase component I [Marinobacterium rhizophilum]
MTTCKLSAPRISLPYPDDSALLFERLRHLPYPVFLDSGQRGLSRGRFDIISAAPRFRVVSHRGRCWKESTEGERIPLGDAPFMALKRIIDAEAHGDGDPDLPFIGGAVGYFAYDLARTLESLPELAQRDIDLPEMQVGIYDWALVIDHEKRLATLVCHQAEFLPQLRQLHELLSASQSHPTGSFSLNTPFAANMNRQQYGERFRRIIDYIEAGDCYQVNLAQRFSAEFTGDSWRAYRALREVAPTPFAAYLSTPSGDLLSLSPERFIQSCGIEVETKPIKGTRPRGQTASEDIRLAEALRHSPKDRAENLMIVDLLRNDLGKTCSIGSVRVPKLFEVETYANVHHLVSTICGRLDHPGKSLDLLQGCFPGGSITGAPKIRSMEVIEEQEPHRRSAYCGSIGYIGFNGRMDTSICIRTLIATQGQLYCWAGGGIVADSNCDAEYQETFDKVNNLLQTLEHRFLHTALDNQAQI